MIIFLDEHVRDNGGDYIAKEPAGIFADFDKRDHALAIAGIDSTLVFPDAENRAIRFEPRNKYDYVAIHMPDLKQDGEEPTLIEIYINQEFMVVLAKKNVLEELAKELVSVNNENLSPAQMLSMFFNHILSQHYGLLEEIEDEIERLEERAILRKPEDHTATIISLRKQLLALKRYYEALYDILVEIEENENHLFSKENLQVLHAQKNKANRLLNNILSLRDYLTQVREAYQNQLDISLNDTMKFFTVIAAIFLPLTLIVGWYGMNLPMPELELAITYPAVIIISLAFVVSSLIYCKKKGWF